MNTHTTTPTVQLSKEVLNNIKKKLNHYTEEQFIYDAQKYINAIKEGRMINIINSVSSSGMSRNIKFTSCEGGNDGRYYQRNYTCLFIALGYTEAKKGYGYFRIGGCGMDMIFHTNYSIIHDFKRFGLIADVECATLAQMTPNTI
jgi:hypothetical protein